MKRDNADKNYRTRIARVVAALVADPMAVHSLEKLAGIAHFSPFHFHRLYRSLVGETIGDTIRRLRLAQAATLLGENRSSVTEIAWPAAMRVHKLSRALFAITAEILHVNFRKKSTGSVATIAPWTMSSNPSLRELNYCIKTLSGYRHCSITGQPQRFPTPIAICGNWSMTVRSNNGLASAMAIPSWMVISLILQEPSCVKIRGSVEQLALSIFPPDGMPLIPCGVHMHKSTQAFLHCILRGFLLVAMSRMIAPCWSSTKIIQRRFRKTHCIPIC